MALSPVRALKSPSVIFLAVSDSARTWCMMKCSPPNHAAARASNPTTNPLNSRWKMYISNPAGVMSKNTLPTNCIRNVENLKIFLIISPAAKIAQKSCH